MKKILIIILALVIFLPILVSARERCEIRPDEAEGYNWCCTNSNEVICNPGEDICGTEEYCDNYLSGGNHCKQSDPTWCCYNAGDVICDEDAGLCGTEEYCENWRNGEKSCIPDTDICCPGLGNIVDYTTGDCCYPDKPFLWISSNGGKGCNFFDKWGIWGASDADNYYTRLSDCSVTIYGDLNNPSSIDKENTCDGTEFVECTSYEQFIWNFENKGKVIGKCGVECTSASDCGENYNALECDANNKNIVNVSEKWSCINNLCDIKTTYNPFKLCSVGCEWANINSGGTQLYTPVCTNIISDRTNQTNPNRNVTTNVTINTTKSTATDTGTSLPETPETTSSTAGLVIFIIIISGTMLFYLWRKYGKK